MNNRVKEIPLELKESVHKIWLAGIGALSLAEEEGSKLFKDLVEKGQKFEGKTETTKQKMVGSLDQVKNHFGDLIHKFEDVLNNGISLGLSKVGVPSKEEIELLTKRVEELMSSVDGLKIVEEKPDAAPAKSATAKKTRTTRTTRTRRTTAKS
jgi:poly(hydroxyalkanoate) granule-associated protein